jgi:uncharacterized spore protein YtfJ
MDVDEAKADAEERFGPGIGEMIAEKLGASARADVVYGEPVERDGVTVIPVARIKTRFGFGFGLDSRKDGRGGGGGGAVHTDPVGYIEIADGKTRFRRTGPSSATGVMTAIGGTIVLTMAVIGAAWGKLGKTE